jgi:hypothetical protein
MRFLACSLVFLSILASGAFAHADDTQPPPPPLRPVGELALRGGWGTASYSAGEGPFGADFGARLGVVTRSDIYIGFRLDRFLGENRSVDVYSYDVGLQVGRDFRFAGDHVVVRPLLGLGFTALEGDVHGCGDCIVSGPAWRATSDGATYFSFEPGVSVLVFPMPWWFVGADASLFLPALRDGGDASVLPVGTLVHGELGVRFR